MTSMTAPTGGTAITETLTGSGRGSLLCVSNFPSDTGYAWTFIEELYAAISNYLAEWGVDTWVAYPSLKGRPKSLNGSRAQPLQHQVRLDRLSSIRATAELIRRKRVRVVYLCDRSSWHPAYALWRVAGVRKVIVHDHTSGERTEPRGLKRQLKLWRRHIPGAQADTVIAVSDYVLQRKIDVDLLPAKCVHRVWNSVDVPMERPSKSVSVAGLGLNPARPVVACAARATREKGIHHLLRAFDRLNTDAELASLNPALIFVGDGPFMPELKSIRSQLRSPEDIVFTGFREDAAELLGAADICVVPSLWAEAFCLSALEAMARGVPVVASGVGGLPEVVRDGETGILVPPADEEALASAIKGLLASSARRQRLGEAARRRALTFFSRDRQISELLSLVSDGFSLPASASVKSRMGNSSFRHELDRV